MNKIINWKFTKTEHQFTSASRFGYFGILNFKSKSFEYNITFIIHDVDIKNNPSKEKWIYLQTAMKSIQSLLYALQKQYLRITWA